MGKKNKQENNQNNSKEENKEKKESEKTIILKALIHCEGCSDQIKKCLKAVEGIDHIRIDRESQRIFVKGEVVKDPLKVLERLQKKFSKNVELISPKPKPDNKHKNDQDKKEQAKVKTVVLKMYMHCEGCATDVKKNLEKMEGVTSVEMDREKSQVIVRGTMESTKLVECAKRKLGKHAEIIKEDKRREAKEKEDKRREAKGEANNNEKHQEPIILFSYPPQYSTQYVYPNQTFSDENVFACSLM